MTFWSRFCGWGDAIFRRDDCERDVNAELQFRIEARSEDLLRHGFSRKRALRWARMARRSLFVCLGEI